MSPSKPDDHYRAVCRALATETLELRTFLQRVCTGEGAEVLRLKAQAETSGKELEKIHFSDWVSFQLRFGFLFFFGEMTQNPLLTP